MFDLFHHDHHNVVGLLPGKVVTLQKTNIAIENAPFIVDLPIQMVILLDCP